MSRIRSRVGRASVVLVTFALALAGLAGLALPSSAALGDGSISGTVRADGAAFLDPYLNLYKHDGSSWRAVRLGGNLGYGTAQYRFDDLDPGTYRVMVSNPREPWVETWYPSADLVENAVDVVVGEGQDVTGTDIDLLREGAVEGTVTDTAGTPLAGVRVTVTDTDQETHYVEAETDAQGRYRAGRLTTDDYVVRFGGFQAGKGSEYWMNAPTRTEATPVQVLSGEDTTGIDAALDVPAVLRGTVVDEETGDPVPYTTVLLYELRNGHWQGADVRAYTDVRGRYELRGVWGTYRVLAIGPSYDTHGHAFHPGVPDVDDAKTVVIPEGGTVEDIDIALPRQADTSTISGTVTAAGRPAPGVEVTAELRLGDAWWEAASLTTAADGTYRAYVGYEGTYRIRFSDPSGAHDDQWWDRKPSAATATPLVVAGDSEVTGIDAELATVPGGTVGGTVTGWEDEQLDDVDVTVYEWSPTVSAWVDVRTVNTDAAGAWSMAGLPAGTYRVGFVDDARRHLPEFHHDSPDVGSADDVQVVADESTTVDGELDPVDGSIHGRVNGEDDDVPLDGIRVTVYSEVDGAWTPVAETGVDELGDYVVDGLTPGDHRVGFEDDDGRLVGEFWYDRPTLDTAVDVGVEPAAVTYLYWADLATAPADPYAAQAAPTVSGTPRAGQTLTASPGRWLPAGASFAYQWLADDVELDGETGQSLTLTADHVGATVRVRVTASGDAPEGVATSEPTSPVVAAATPAPTPSPTTGTTPTTPASPSASPTPSPTPTSTPTSTPAPVPTPTPAISNTARPRVSGTPRVGTVLRARPGTWSPAAVTLTYQWRADGKRVPRADGVRLTVTRKLLGSRLTVRVRAALDGARDVVATSRPTAKIKPRPSRRVRPAGHEVLVWTVSRRLPGGFS